MADIVRRTADALHEISDVLHGTGEGDWKGRHAEAFRERFDDDFRPRVDQARRSFGKAATALVGWADAMPEWQRKAAALERRAKDALDARHAAEQRLAGLPPAFLIDPKAEDGAGVSKREKNEKDRAAAELAIATARADFERVAAEARNLAIDFDIEGRAVARRLDKAMDIAPDEPGVFDKLGDAVVGIGKALDTMNRAAADAVSAAVGDAVEWLAEHANSIAALGDVLGTVSAALGAISLGLAFAAPETGPLAPLLLGGAEVIGLASGGFSLGALAVHGTARAVGGDAVVSDRTLAEDALGVLPFGGVLKGVSRVAAESRLAVGAANFGLVDTVAAFMGDPTALGYWGPDNERQVAEDVVVPGGAMLVAFENAWHAGSEKDRAAREKEQASR
ncbi:hypothetical protein ACFY6U_28450 [Streptomyces sp. NPDC013157]|uniref:hypothetical protein n=1 Tax=Streptomyces sp. NPDC013157 TaxID=3364861 RepID=UPI003696992E